MSTSLGYHTLLFFFSQNLKSLFKNEQKWAIGTSQERIAILPINYEMAYKLIRVIQDKTTVRSHQAPFEWLKLQTPMFDEDVQEGLSCTVGRHVTWSYPIIQSKTTLSVALEAFCRCDSHLQFPG